MCCAIATMGAVYASPCAPEEQSCEVWLTGKAVGKVSAVENKGSWYKNVESLSIKSCQLVVTPTNDPVVVVVGTRKGAYAKEFVKTLTCTEFKWNVFGKNLDKADSGKTVSLKSEIKFEAEDEEGTKMKGVLFGTVTAKADGASACSESCTTYTPGTFSGWFIGEEPLEGCECVRQLTATASEDNCTKCLWFDESDEEIGYFGGTINLKYNKVLSGYKAR